MNSIIAHTNSYIENNNKKPDNFQITADIVPIYLKLAETWSDWKKYNGETLPKDAQEELDKLLDGLTLYFSKANDIQESLVSVCSQVAWKVMLANGLLASISRNIPDLLEKGGNSMDKESLNDTIEHALKTLMPDRPLQIPDVSDNLINVIENVAKKHRSSDSALSNVTSQEIGNLRKAIEDWVLDSFSPPEHKNYDAAITLFRAVRNLQITAANNYENRLVKLARLIKLSSSENMNGLSTALQNRLREVESFRNGVIRKLAPQKDILTRYEVSDNDRENIKSVAAELISSDDPDNFVHEYEGKLYISLQDMPADLCNLDSHRHPLISSLQNMQNSVISVNCVNNNTNDNALHRGSSSNPLTILESGVKSPLRTIEKLITGRNSDWRLMSDICRTSPVFESIDDMFFFHRALNHHLNRSENPDFEITNDTVSVLNSGVLKWHIKLGCKSDGIGAEIKLQDAMQDSVEWLTHQIYECVRKLEKRGGTIDINSMSKHDVEEFIKFVGDTVSNISRQCELRGDMDEALTEAVKNISVSINKVRDSLDNNEKISSAPDKSGSIAECVKSLQRTHLIISLNAARNASPKMAALYTIMFERMTEKVDTAPDDLVIGKRELSKLFSDYGPKMIEDKSPPWHKGFTESDREYAEALLDSIKNERNKSAVRRHNEH